jgi:hypothetical protein
MSNDFLTAAMNAFEGAQVSDDVINWDSVESEGGGFEPLPEGSYQLVVEKAERRTSPKGAEQISLTYGVVDGKRKIFDTLTYKDYPGYTKSPTAKSTPANIGLARIKGLLQIGGKDLNSFKFSECWQLVGIRFTGKVKIDTYNPEKPKNKVSSISAPAGQAKEKLDF